MATLREVLDAAGRSSFGGIIAHAVDYQEQTLRSFVALMSGFLTTSTAGQNDPYSQYLASINSDYLIPGLAGNDAFLEQKIEELATRLSNDNASYLSQAEFYRQIVSGITGVAEPALNVFQTIYGV